MLEEGALRCDVNVSVRQVEEEYVQELEKIEVAPFVAENIHPSFSSNKISGEHSSSSSSSSSFNKNNSIPSSINLSQVLEFRRRNLQDFGPRVEMKNLSSIRAVYRAVDRATNFAAREWKNS